MTIEEQLMELIGSTVFLDGVDPESYNGTRALTVENDYLYRVDWVCFLSELVERVDVTRRIIYFTGEGLEAIETSDAILHPERLAYTRHDDPVEVPDWIKYANYEPPFNPYDEI